MTANEDQPQTGLLVLGRKPTIEAVAEMTRARGLDPLYVLDRLQHTSFVSQKHRYVYISVPKAACTKLKYFITRIEGGALNIGNKPYLSETRMTMLIHHRRHVSVPTIFNLGEAEVRNILSGQSDYFIFALTRNPFSRLVSIYENKVRLFEPDFDEAGKRWGAAESGADVRLAFSKFVKEGVMKFIEHVQDHHFVPQSELLMPELVPYTQLFPVEQFGQFEKVFFEKLRQAGYTGKLEFRDRNRTAHPDWRYYYDEETAACVAEIYKADFEAFGYDVNSWRIEGEPPEMRTTPEEAYWRNALIERNKMIQYLYGHIRPSDKKGEPERHKAQNGHDATDLGPKRA